MADRSVMKLPPFVRIIPSGDRAYDARYHLPARPAAGVNDGLYWTRDGRWRHRDLTQPRHAWYSGRAEGGRRRRLAALRLSRRQPDCGRRDRGWQTGRSPRNTPLVLPDPGGWRTP